MNRPIKFRAWDKEAKRFFCPAPRLNAITISITLNGEIIGHPNVGEVTSNYELSQFTGLLDKNGKEIYEGDIINIPNWGYPFYVIYNRNKCKFCCQLRGGINDFIPYNSIVIGNIYENPELLSQNK